MQDGGGSVAGEVDAAMPDFFQRLPGTRHAGGGRTVGTRSRTRSTLPVGYERALALSISNFGLEEWASAVGVPGSADAVLPSLKWYVEENASLDYSGKVWELESVVGAVARFSDSKRHEHDDPEVLAIWIAFRCNVACTCVQSTAYEAALDPDATRESDASCDHASLFSSAMKRLALAAKVPNRGLRRRLAALTDKTEEKGAQNNGRGRRSSAAGAKGARLIADDVEVFNTGGLPIGVVLSGSGLERVPAPIKCARKRTTRCYCDSARASSCTHIQQSRHYRQSDAGRTCRSGAEHKEQPKRAADSISQLTISALDCNRSVQVDMDILDHARSGRPYVIDCPSECWLCSTPRGNAPDESQEGTILCHNAFCRMLLMA